MRATSSRLSMPRFGPNPQQVSVSPLLGRSFFLLLWLWAQPIRQPGKQEWPTLPSASFAVSSKSRLPAWSSSESNKPGSSIILVNTSLPAGGIACPVAGCINSALANFCAPRRKAASSTQRTFSAPLSSHTRAFSDLPPITAPIPPRPAWWDGTPSISVKPTQADAILFSPAVPIQPMATSLPNLSCSLATVS